MDAIKFATAAPKVKGQRLEKWLERWLTASAEDLVRWQGNFTEVTTAKVVEILRKRGVTEAVEAADKAKFDRLVNLAYRLPDPPPEEQSFGSTTPMVDGPENPLVGRELRFEADSYEQKNRAFFGRLAAAAVGTEIKYFADDNGDAYYDVLGIVGEDRLETIPAPLFMRIVGLAEEGDLAETIGNFLRPYFTLTEHTRSEWDQCGTI